MKKALRISAVLLLSLPLAAQLTTGDVRGRVVDPKGQPLPGIRITLSRPQSPDRTDVTGPSGVFRFPSVVPGRDYSLKAEREESKTVTRAGLVVELGGTVEVEFVMEPGKPEEAVAATDPLPAIDRAKLTAGASFGRTELQTLPTARDPWVVVQLVPSVLLDRENVGGSESVHPSSFVAKGAASNGQANTWAVDGVDITDPVDLGASAVRFDFDAIDSIAVTTGGAADVTQPTGGIAVNVVTRRGGNALGGSARFYLTDNAFQAANLTDALRTAGVSNTNRIERITDYGFNVGGPIVQNRLWLWGSYGAQDVFTFTIFDTPDRALFSNAGFKLNAEPFRGNSFEALFLTSAKDRYGVNAGFAKPEGDRLSAPYRLGGPIGKIQDSQTIGRSFALSAKYAWTRTGESTTPMVDQDLANPAVFDVSEGRYVAFSDDLGKSWDYGEVIQENRTLQVSAALFRDDLLGLDHELKGGIEFADRTQNSDAGYPQNYHILRNLTEPLIDLGEGLVAPPSEWQQVVIERENRRSDRLKRSSAYLQDTMTSGRLTLQLGLRYDYQEPSSGAVGLSTVVSGWSNAFASDTMTNLNAVFPPLSIKAIDPKYEWSTWSPRLGLSWDIKGDGRTVLKLALAQYGDILAAGSNVPRPLGIAGNLNFWWNDADEDSVIDITEVFWKYSPIHAEAPNQLYALFASGGGLTAEALEAVEGGFESDAYLAGNYAGYDWDDREAINYDSLTTFFRSDIDPEAGNVKTSPRTREILLSLEKELGPDLAAAAAITYRRYDNFDWAKLYYPADLYPSTPDLVIDSSETWYTVAGTIPETITVDEDTTIDLGDAGGRSWYLPVEDFPGDTPYRLVDKSDSFRTYVGLDLAVTKRLSKRWFMNASLTLQDQRVHWGESFIDPTNQWALDGKPYGNQGTGSEGKADIQMHARWIAKINGLYQLPAGFSVAATLLAREGWKVPNYIVLAYADPGSWPGPYRSSVVYLQSLTKDRLPALGNLSLRLEKSFALGPGRMIVMADIFNVLNSAVVNRATDAYFGTYYVDTEEYAPNPTNRLFNEVLNPRVMRLGVRFEF